MSLASGALPGIYSVLSVWVCVCVYSVHVHRPIICKSTHTYEMQTKTLIQIPPLPPPWAHPPPAVPSLLWSPSPLSSREFRSSSLFTWRISRKFSSVCPPCSQCYLLLVLRFFFFCLNTGKYYLSRNSFRIYINSSNSLLWVPRLFII